MRRRLLALAALPLLAGCGRTGPPRPPGPPEAVTWPRPYPALRPEDRAAGAPAPRATAPVAPPLPVSPSVR